MIRVKPIVYVTIIYILFENLVNYDKSKTAAYNYINEYQFENLVNYDKSKTSKSVLILMWYKKS